MESVHLGPQRVYPLLNFGFISIAQGNCLKILGATADLEHVPVFRVIEWFGNKQACQR